MEQKSKINIKEFYARNRNAINVGLGIVLLYGIAKASKMNYTLTQQQFEDEVRRGGIINPLAGRLVLTSGFGPRVHPVTGEKSKFHNGADLVLRGGNSLGANILAPYSGKVVVNNYQPLGGHQVVIDSGWARFGFAHLQSPSPLPVGTLVKKGDVVGKLGNSGTGTGPHLHYTLRLNGQYADPVKTFPALRDALR